MFYSNPYLSLNVFLNAPISFSLTVQFLIDLSAFVIPKQLIPRGRLRGSGGGPMGSSLPRHGARKRTKTQSKKKKKQKPRADCKLAQKNIEKKSI